ncbi:myelomonocytic growth factor-like [Zootoca vivipara]|uniref:myelomonocytic growth factor-like n=1 Tax=Zootoca vivipara TaxID=8524 RepID=UPI00293BF19E|nr:myelomonocytic growth factor-like [Zootoca vivipara]
MSSERSVIFPLISIALWWWMCSATPLPETSGYPDSVLGNLEFVLRIRKDVAKTKNDLRKEFRIGSDNELQLVQEILRIEQVDYSHCRKELCNKEDCFNQIQAGLSTYLHSLSHVAQMLPSFSKRVTDLQLDLSNLSTNIQWQILESVATTVTYPQGETLDLQNQRAIGSYLVIRNLEKFTEAIARALRHCYS